MKSIHYRKPSAKAPVIDPGDEAPFLVRGGEERSVAATLSCLTEAGKPAMIGIDVLASRESGRLMATKQARERKHTKKKTPTFLLELPLVVEQGQAARLRAHLEAGRQFYNAILAQGRRLRRMRADPAWQAARAIPRTHKQERRAAFSALREQYGFTEYALHELAKLRVSWIAEHLERSWPRRWPPAPTAP